eukprot:6073047-Alexandrium_andersonii.AAC.1
MNVRQAPLQQPELPEVTERHSIVTVPDCSARLDDLAQIHTRYRSRLVLSLIPCISEGWHERNLGPKRDRS